MAHPNISDRRRAVEILYRSGTFTTKDLNVLASKFGCTRTAINNDIIVLDHGSPQKVSALIKKNILERDGYVCYLCERQVEEDRVIIEHIVPARAGGKATETNLAVACQSCNMKKRETDKNLYPEFYLKRFK